MSTQTLRIKRSNPLMMGALADHGFSENSTVADVQDFLDQHSNGRLRLLDFHTSPNPIGIVQAHGMHYCRECRTIMSSILQPHLISDCIVCNQSARFAPADRAHTFWNYHRFCNSRTCAEALGVVYLFQLEGHERGVKFGFSYDPAVRARGNCLYGPLLWSSRVTTRAAARVVELDLHSRVTSGLFDRPQLTADQRQAAGSSETFLLREPWDIDSIVTHVEATLNEVEQKGWRTYWETMLDGLDGCPISNDQSIAF